MPYATAGSLCAIAGPHGGLLIYLLLLLVLAAYGMRWLTETLGFSALAVVCSVASYLGSPVVLNKLHAGHLHFIFSYAALPFFLAAVRDQRTAKSPIILGTLLGLASAQQQFFPFGIFLALLLGVHYGWTWYWRTALPAFVFALCVTAPQWILAATHGSSGNLDVYQPLMHWEASQSVPFGQALRFLGYIGGYDLALPQWLRVLTWIFPACAFAGACIAIAYARGRTWVVGAFCALAMVNGLYGPIGPAVAIAMQHSGIVAAFRELYTFEAVVAICYAVLAGILITAITRPAKLGWLTVSIATILVVTSLSVAFFDTRGIPIFQPSSESAAMISRLAAAPGFSRYLQVPSALPQSLLGSRMSGISPFTLPIGSHPSALDTLYETPYSAVVAAQNAGRPISKSWLNALNISDVLTVPDVVQTNNYEPLLNGIFPAVPEGRQSFWSLMHRKAERVELLPSVTPVEVVRGLTLDLVVQAQNVNPRNGWARTALWNNLPAWIYDRPAGIFTLKNALSLALPDQTSIIAGSATGKLRTSGCIVESRLDAHYSMLQCKGSAMLDAIPPIVVSEAVRGTIDFFKPAAGGTIRVLASNLLHVDLDVHAPPNSAIEMRERLDPGWQCLGCDAIQGRAEGYASAWILPRGLNRHVTIAFAPARVYYMALAVSVVALVAAFVNVVLVFLLKPAGCRRSATGGVIDQSTSP